MLRLKEVAIQTRALDDEFIALSQAITYREQSQRLTHEDPEQLAIAIQERFNLPKWQEQHPSAPLLWQQCKAVAKVLHRHVRTRNHALAEAKMHLQQDSHRKLMDSFSLLESGALLASSHELQRLSHELGSSHERLAKARACIAEIDAATERIDTPCRLELLKNSLMP